MIIDYRIYLTIGVPMFLALWAICFLGMATLDDGLLQRKLQRALVTGFVILGATGLTAYLDWLWS